MIAIRGRLATVGEVFFDAPARDATVDLVRYVQRSAPLPGARCEEFHTLLIDLTQDADALWRDVHHWNRKKIRRAERDGLAYEAWHPATPGPVAEFCDFHERSTRRALVFGLHRGRLLRYAELGALDLSAIGDGSRRLSWHAHYRTPSRARELFSVTVPRPGLTTAERALVGRAHRLQHWRDLLRFRAEGVAVYDFGGVSLGTRDPKFVDIAEFKRSFGGTVVAEYNCVEARTARGAAAIAIERLLRALGAR